MKQKQKKFNENTPKHLIEAQEAFIMSMRFNRKTEDRMTLQEIGNILFLTRERVRQKIEKAIKKPRYRHLKGIYVATRRKFRFTSHPIPKVIKIKKYSIA